MYYFWVLVFLGFEVGVFLEGGVKKTRLFLYGYPGYQCPVGVRDVDVTNVRFQYSAQSANSISEDWIPVSEDRISGPPRRHLGQAQASLEAPLGAGPAQEDGVISCPEAFFRPLLPLSLSVQMKSPTPFNDGFTA